MNPKLEQILDMPYEEMVALSPNELLAHAEEMYRLAIKEDKYPPELLAQIKRQRDQYARSVSDQRQAERALEIATQNRAIMQADFDRTADFLLDNLPTPKNVH